MARNDGRVQTQELNIFQPIQPAPMAGSTFVRAPEAPRDNALLQIADSLSSMSQGLGQWAHNQRMQQGIDAHNDKKQAEIAATVDAAKYANDPAGYMGELAKQQTTYRRDAYAAHAGLLYAQRFQTEAADWYDTKFDKEKGDILADSNSFRNQYAAQITDPASKAAFLDLRSPCSARWLAATRSTSKPVWARSASKARPPSTTSSSSSTSVPAQQPGSAPEEPGGSDQGGEGQARHRAHRQGERRSPAERRQHVRDEGRRRLRQDDPQRGSWGQGLTAR
jgi:hypothetical protein